MTMCEKLGFKSVVQYKGVSMNVDMKPRDELKNNTIAT